MADQFLSCLGTRVRGVVEVKSPSIGRARVLVEKGQWVVKEQVVAELTRMNQRFWLLAPSECVGSIVEVKDRNYLVPLAYGETFLLVENVAIEQEASSFKAESLPAGLSIDAPMDGMFYLSPSPSDPPFITIGDEVSPGQTVGLIEVMKCFYPMVYQGHNRVKIVGINVKNASPVACGDKLITISP